MHVVSDFKRLITLRLLQRPPASLLSKKSNLMPCFQCSQLWRKNRLIVKGNCSRFHYFYCKMQTVESTVFTQKFRQINVLLKNFTIDWFDGKKFAWQWISRFSTLWILNFPDCACDSARFFCENFGLPVNDFTAAVALYFHKNWIRHNDLDVALFIYFSLLWSPQLSFLLSCTFTKLGHLEGHKVSWISCF